MKAVMLSIQPKWIELIANGKKTVEVRKTKPKIDVPFKCYIYCTKDHTFAEKTLRGFDENGKAIYYKANKGKVIGEFVCRNIDFLNEHDLFEGMDEISNSRIEEYSCLDIDELLRYKGDKQEIYGWHISNLVIYDQPRGVSGFYHYCGDNPKCDGCEAHYYSNTECGKEDYCYSPMDGCRPLKRPPQSWCYCEELKGETE